MHAFRQLAASTRATPQRLALPLLANACRVPPPLPQPRASVRGRCLSTDPGKVGPGAVGWLSAKMSKQMSKMGAFNAVKAAADKGDAQAMTLMGVCYAMGRDVAQDDSRAAEWFRRAADKGNPEGALALGNWLLQGRGGLVADQAEAFKHIQFASDKGVLEAHTMLGIMHNEGSGVLRDHKKAAAAFSKAVPADLKAMYNLGVLMIQGKGVKPQQSKGMEYVRRAATGGVAEAQFTVSIWYRDGALGTKQDHKRAYEWAVKAAKQGHSQAQHNVAVQLAEGVGVAQSQRQAADWYNAAVGNGQVESMCNLGLLLLTGAPGLDQDAEAGHRLVEAAASRGHAPAVFNLALCFDRGLGVEKDSSEALRYLRKAAELKFQPAVRELVACLRSGSLGEVNEAEADRWERHIEA